MSKKSMDTYYEQVKGIMTKYPKSRDDDMLLYSIFLHMNGLVKPEERFYDVVGSQAVENIIHACRKAIEEDNLPCEERSTVRE